MVKRSQDFGTDHRRNGRTRTGCIGADVAAGDDPQGLDFPVFTAGQGCCAKLVPPVNGAIKFLGPVSIPFDRTGLFMGRVYRDDFLRIGLGADAETSAKMSNHNPEFVGAPAENILTQTFL